MRTLDRGFLISEFLDGLQQRAEDKFGGRLHEAFVDWYVDAEFGRVDWKFTDNAGDGGIDAVAWRPDECPSVVLIQSKFSENIGRSKLNSAAYKDLREVVQAFRYGDDAFDEFLENVRSDTKRLYRKAFQQLQDCDHWAHGKKAFRLITTHRPRRADEFDDIPRSSFIYGDEILRLYSQYRRGQTPRARPLELTVVDKLTYTDPKRQVCSYIFNAQLVDFREYLDHTDVARLVARNIRYNLAGKIGRAIRATYEKSPKDFWYYHNGLTIICDAMEEKNRRAVLINPSVVNGAQTLYAVSESTRNNPSALVTVRVIVRGEESGTPVEDDDWLQNVIRGVNTQNRVKAADFWTNEPEQYELQHRFRAVGVFYERKRGEWREYRNEARYRNFGYISLRVLGWILAVCRDDNGEGVLLAKSGEEYVFAEKSYRRLFPSRVKMVRRFEGMYLAYRVYTILNKCGYASSAEYHRQKHGGTHQ